MDMVLTCTPTLSSCKDVHSRCRQLGPSSSVDYGAVRPTVHLVLVFGALLRNGPQADRLGKSLSFATEGPAVPAESARMDFTGHGILDLTAMRHAYV